MAPPKSVLPLHVHPNTLSSDASSTSPRSETSRASEITSRSSAPLVQHTAALAGAQSVYDRITQGSHVPKNEGWPLLAQLMVKKPDFEAFSRFRDLNVKNLLYYQVELDQLRRRLEEQEREDREGTDEPEKKFAQSAEILINSDSDQWEQIKGLRKLLREYNKALLLYSQISALPEPSTDNMKQLQAWLTNPKCGNYCINGAGCDAWGELHTEPAPPPSLGQLLGKLVGSLKPFGKLKYPRTKAGLVAPRPGRNVDGLTRWIEDEVIPIWYYFFLPPQESKETTASTTGSNEDVSSSAEKNSEKEEQEDVRIARTKCYSERTMLKITSGIATVVACVLPTVAIGVLTTADTRLQKLLYIGGFTALFSIGLTFLTNETSRVQIFTATAAFSAVLVVFVQNQ